MTPTPILYSLQGAMFSISTRIPYSHNTRLFSKSHSNPLLSVSHKPRSSISTNTAREEQEQEDDFRVLTATKTEYNNIIILESHGSKLLLLDDSCNVHSILYKDQIWTNSYWDEFTSLPAITPPGPIAVFGLGGGTIAHQLLHFCPTLCLHGWELDEILIDRARQFLGLSVLETANESGGILHVHVGDALLHSASVEGGFAGIIVDLFSNAKVLPELEQVDTWLEMKKKLMPNGRIMVNCGGEISLIEKGKWEENLTIQAMCGAFGKKLVNWKKMSKSESGNYLAFTGQLPEVHYWSTAVPEKLRATVALWKACEP